jgi:molecular chaperone DnaK (HSP70)
MNTSNIKNSHVVGIDLGTTNSVLAILDDAGRPKVIPNREGDTKTPSAIYVSLDGGEILVGAAALNMQCLEPDRVVVEFKREVGTDKVYFRAGDIDVTPEWCQTQVLKYLRESAHAYFGDASAAGKALVTVPAYFTERERQSVSNSAKAAGFELLGLVNEPTAAGLAFGVAEGQADKLVVIADFGGGTLDVSVVAFESGEARVLASFGDKHLGGKDVDALLIGLVVEEFSKVHGLDLSRETHPADWYAIRDEVIRQKHMLSSRTEVKISARVDGRPVAITIDRTMLKELLAPLLRRAEEVLLRAVGDAKVDLKDIQHVLPVGGSIRLTPFMERLHSLLGKDIVRGGQVSPDLGIAEGAAIAAVKRVAAGGETLVTESLQRIPEPAIKHTDVMPHALGVSVQDPVSKECRCSAILEKNTPVPSDACRLYGSVDDRQTRFKISVLQGEAGRPIKECLVVGERELELPARPSSQPSIEVRMSYDTSAMVQVLVKDMVSNQIENITVDFSQLKAIASA